MCYFLLYVPTPEAPEYSFDGHSHVHYQLANPLPARRTWVQVLVRTRKHSSTILNLISKDQSEYVRLEVQLDCFCVFLCESVLLSLLQITKKVTHLRPVITGIYGGIRCNYRKTSCIYMGISRNYNIIMEEQAIVTGGNYKVIMPE